MASGGSLALEINKYIIYITLDACTRPGKLMQGKNKNWKCFNCYLQKRYFRKVFKKICKHLGFTSYPFFNQKFKSAIWFWPVYSRLPDPLSVDCSNVVFTLGPAVLDYLSNSSTPDTLCYRHFFISFIFNNLFIFFIFLMKINILPEKRN